MHSLMYSLMYGIPASTRNIWNFSFFVVGIILGHNNIIFQLILCVISRQISNTSAMKTFKWLIMINFVAIDCAGEDCVLFF